MIKICSSRKYKDKENRCGAKWIGTRYEEHAKELETLNEEGNNSQRKN
jgi:hypothetical protein